ncbi:MAG TPA: pentapeptide repeat-containing protein [Bacillota bacterium]
MTRTAALQHFQANYVKGISQAKLLAVEAYFRQHREELAVDFINSFQAICHQAQTMQRQQAKGKIAYVHYSWLRTRILEGDYRVLIQAYDNNWYLDRRECRAEYDAGWLWRFWQEFAAELEMKRRPYLNRITGADLERIILREAVNYSLYLVNLGRWALYRYETTNGYLEIEREAEFEVRLGEYRDLSEIIFKADHRAKDSREIRNWLAEKTPFEYCYEVLRGLNLEAGDYEGLDLRFCDLRECNLSRSNLQNTILLGVKMAGSRLDGANLQGALIYEADFSKSSLRTADFSEAEGPFGLMTGSEWQRPGFDRISFREADLTGAVFKDCQLQGADFRGARLEKVDFEGANLHEALFYSTDRQSVKLTRRQMAEICWV